MPKPKADLIVTQQHKRYFYMKNGAAPNGLLRYAGRDGQFINIDSASIPKGDISPINVGSPDKFKEYEAVGFSIDSPDLPTFTVQFLEMHGGVPIQLYNLGDCDTTFWEPTGSCKDPSILSRKIGDYVKIYAAGDNTNTETGGSAFDSDDMVEDPLDFTALGGIYAVGALAVGEEAAAEVYSEVVDVVYGSNAQCAGCGPNDNGAQKIYWAINNTVASPGVGPAVGYSVDGLATQTVTAINGASADDIPVAIDIVGDYLVVAYRNATTGGYFYSQLNSVTGKPGTWTNVTTGFVSGNQPLDMHVGSAREVYFCGNGGYIYKSTNILNGVSVSDAGNATTDNLNRINGQGGHQVVAVGDGAAVVFSQNRGNTWSVTTNSPAAFSLDALEVIDEYLWIVGTDGGEVFYSNTQGEDPWLEISLPSLTAGSPAAIQDIVFATPEVGYIVATTSDPAGLFYSTITGGAEWEDGSLNTFPTLDRINRIAYPKVGNRAIASNNLAFAGLAGDGSDGILMLGTTQVKG